MDPRRLRHGDWVAALSALALLVLLFFDWFGLDLTPPGTTDVVAFGSFSGDGWSTLGWLALVLCVLAIVIGLANGLLTATRESPAGPVLAAILTMVFGFLATVALLIQLWAQPGPDEYIAVKAPFWLGLAAAAGVWLGGWLAVRDERVPRARVRPVDVRPAPPAAAGPAAR